MRALFVQDGILFLTVSKPNQVGVELGFWFQPHFLQVKMFPVGDSLIRESEEEV